MYSPQGSARSLGEHTPASVVSNYSTPRSGRQASPRTQARDELLEVSVAPEDLAFAAKCKREFSAPNVKEVLSFARHGKRDEVEEALQAGYPIDANDELGNTLLIVSCQNGQKKIAKMAADAGADLNKQNNGGNTALHFLYTFGYQELATYFEGLGADTNIKNKLGLACREGIKR